MNVTFPARRLSFWTRCLVAAACGAVVAAGVAQPTNPPPTTPTTRPAAGPPASGDRTAPATRPAWGRRGPPGSRLLRFRDITGLAAPDLPEDQNLAPADDDEWQRITEFAQESFPNRWKRFTEVQAARGVGSDVVARLKERIVARYRTLKRVEIEFPDVYAAALNQGKLEDDAWGASVALRRSPKDPRLAAAMREKVAALVKDVLRERQARIDALKLTIQAQQDDLDKDNQDVGNLINQQMNRLTGDVPGDPGDSWRRRLETIGR